MLDYDKKVELVRNFLVLESLEKEQAWIDRVDNNFEAELASAVKMVQNLVSLDIEIEEEIRAIDWSVVDPWLLLEARKQRENLSGYLKAWEKKISKVYNALGSSDSSPACKWANKIYFLIDIDMGLKEDTQTFYEQSNNLLEKLKSHPSGTYESQAYRLRK
jgi:hypothetical protein